MKNLLIIFLISLISFTASAIDNKPLQISIPDVKIGNTVIKRKAQLFTMTYNQGNKSLVLNWKVMYYSDSLGHYGKPIDIEGISSYTRESVADNSVMVNSITGDIVEPDATGKYPTGISLMGQYDFFYKLAEESDINVHDLIISYGMKVDKW